MVIIMRRIYLGIDPGKYGAIAAIKYDSRDVSVFPFPLAGNDLDLTAINNWIRSMIMHPDNTMFDYVACIEKVGAMPGQGVTSMFNFGFVTGALHGIISSYAIPRFMATPQAWKKLVLAGTKQDKEAAVSFCNRVYPTVPLTIGKSTKPNDGMAEAICIATYALMSNL
jgi:crossover junction endodeoxyribonuclease RuvC